MKVLAAILGLSASLHAIDAISLHELSLMRREWGVDEGLPHDRSLGTAQTSDGALWVCSGQGLYRFNGSSFQLQPLETRHPAISQLLMDREDRLWLTAQSGEVMFLDGGKFRKAADSKDIGQIRKWFPHPTEGVILFTKDPKRTGLYHLADSEIIPLGQPETTDLWRIGASPDGRIWLLERRGSLFEWKDEAMHPVAVKNAGCFITSPEGTLLTVGRKGIHEYQDGTWKPKVTFSDRIASRLPPGSCSIDPEGRYWITSTGDGLWVATPKGDLYELQSGVYGLPKASTSTFVDMAGDVWVNTFGGLFQLRYSPFIPTNVPPEFDSREVLQVHPQGSRAVWFSGFGGMARLRAGESVPQFLLPFKANDPHYISPNPDGTAWLSSRFGDISFYRDGERIPGTKDPHKGQFTPTDLHSDAQGCAWMSSYNGIYKTSPDSLHFTKISGKNGLPNEPYQFISFDPDGRPWAFGRSSGIYRMNSESNRWEAFKPPGNPIPKFASIHDIDEQGHLWGVAPTKGLLGWWSDKRAEHITLSDLGLGDLTVRGVACDLQDGLWLNTQSRGVLHLKRSELLKRFDDENHAVYFHEFGTPDGLPSKGAPYTSQNIERDTTGRIHVATQRGLATIDPTLWERRLQDAKAPRVRVEEFATAADFSPIQSLPESFPPGTDSLTLLLAADTYGFAGEVKYRYRFGKKEPWIDHGDDNLLYLRRLGPGSHRIEIQARDRFGMWSDQSAMVSLHILPHFWQRQSFQLSLILAVILLSAFLIHRRIQALRKKAELRAEFSRQLIRSQEGERKRIATELHDGLGQSLLIIRNMVTLSKKANPEDEMLNTMSETSMAALEEVRAISRDLRPPELDQLGLVKAIESAAKRLRESSGINIETDVDTLPDKLEPDHDIAIFRIIQEALNNVIKHARANQAKVTATTDAKGWKITIEDDGVGFDPQNLSDPGVGLLGMRERADLIGAALQINRIYPTGTRITVSRSS